MYFRAVAVEGSLIHTYALLLIYILAPIITEDENVSGRTYKKLSFVVEWK